MTIHFPLELYKKLRTYVEGIDYEISGIGRVRVEGNEIYVEEIRIFDQIVTGGDTKISHKIMGKFYDNLIREGGDPSEWKFWWHSHCNMQAFFSNTDTKYINDGDLETEIDNWLVSLVTNHRGQFECRMDIYAPVRYTISDIDMKISFEDPELKAEIANEIAEKVYIAKTPMWERKKNHRMKNLARRRDVVNPFSLIPPGTTIVDGLIVTESLLTEAEKELLLAVKESMR